MSPYVFLGLVLLHQGEEFVLILPLALLTGAWLLMSWAGKGDTADATGDQDETTSV